MAPASKPLAEACRPAPRRRWPLPRAPTVALVIAALSSCLWGYWTTALMCNRTPGWQGTGEEENAEHLARVHVVYSSDATNFPGLYFSMLSLVRNLQEPGNCTIHIIVPERDLQKADALMACFWAEVHDLPALPEVLLHTMFPQALNASGMMGRWTSANELAYEKFYLHETLQKVSRVIWMDTDTIVLADVARLYRVRMMHPLAAALQQYDELSVHKPRLPMSLQKFVADWSARIFNAGVLVFDLERWRVEGFAGELVSMAKELKGYDLDQLPLNLLFQSRFDQLDSRWNIAAMPHHSDDWLPCVFQEIWVLHVVGWPKYWNKYYVDDMDRSQLMPLLRRRGVMPKKVGDCRVFMDLWQSNPY